MKKTFLELGTCLKILFLFLLYILIIVSCSKKSQPTIEKTPAFHPAELCQRGSVLDCLKVKGDYPQAEKYYKIACDKGVFHGCVLLGHRYKFNVSKKKFAHALYQKACIAGEESGCTALNELDVDLCFKKNDQTACARDIDFLEKRHNQLTVRELVFLFIRNSHKNALSRLRKRCAKEKDLKWTSQLNTDINFNKLYKEKLKKVDIQFLRFLFLVTFQCSQKSEANNLIQTLGNNFLLNRTVDLIFALDLEKKYYRDDMPNIIKTIILAPPENDCQGRDCLEKANNLIRMKKDVLESYTFQTDAEQIRQQMLLTINQHLGVVEEVTNK